MSQPTLRSRRLILRPFQLNDASSVQKLAGDRLIADTTMNVPHPYEDGMAEQRTVSRLNEMQSQEFLSLERRDVDTSLT